VPEIIIQPDGSLLIPRGCSANNQFFITLLEDLTNKETQVSLSDFFEISEQSEIIFGTPGLCG